MYITLCGYPPFNAHKDEEIMRKVEKGVFTFPKEDWKVISLEVKLLLIKWLPCHFNLCLYHLRHKI